MVAGVPSGGVTGMLNPSCMRFLPSGWGVWQDGARYHTSAANPKFAPQLPRVQMRTSGSKRHWNHRFASVLRFRSSHPSEPRTPANFGIGTLAGMGRMTGPAQAAEIWWPLAPLLV